MVDECHDLQKFTSILMPTGKYRRWLSPLGYSVQELGAYSSCTCRSYIVSVLSLTQRYCLSNNHSHLHVNVVFKNLLIALQNWH